MGSNLEQWMAELRAEVTALRKEQTNRRPEVSEDRAAAPMLLTYKQAAQQLACSERHVKRLVAGGVLGAVEVGSLRRIPRSEVERIASQAMASRRKRETLTPRRKAATVSENRARLRELRKG